jgi:hypothetical protein
MDDAGDFISDVNVEYSALSLASVKEKDGFSVGVGVTRTSSFT